MRRLFKICRGVWVAVCLVCLALWDWVRGNFDRTPGPLDETQYPEKRNDLPWWP